MSRRSVNNGHYVRPMEIAAGFSGLGNMLAAAPAGVKAAMGTKTRGPRRMRARQGPVNTPTKGMPTAVRTGKQATQALLASRGMPTPLATMAHQQRQAANPLARRVPRALLASLRGVEVEEAGVAGMDGFLDFLKPVANAVKGMVPQKTIIGKLLNGNVKGAASATMNLAHPKPPAPPAATFAPGPMEVFAPQNDTQRYMLYGAAGLAGVLVLMMVTRK